MSTQPVIELLVIGYGNTLRRDDGVGPKVVEALATENLPGVQPLACPQLTPEIAAPIAQARRVVFVDAAVDAPREVQLRPLTAAPSAQILAHAADPRTMLALARDVFGHTPAAWWLTIPIAELGFGEELSPLAQEGLAQALKMIRRLAADGQMPSSKADQKPTARLRLNVRGAVQGVGFRPFVHRLATELALAGWVNNSAQGVTIEVEGADTVLQSFLLRLEAERPPHSFIQSLESSWLDPAGYTGFEIRPSTPGGDKTALILPDIATCPECRREIFDPTNRRYRYPFTNCTHCGPRFSILTALPYDRVNTTMAGFTMCPACRAEYDDPTNRRFHAQPNACPACGPQLELWRGRTPAREADDAGSLASRVLERGHDALLATAAAIRAGQIVAVKGLGGFHFMVDARNEDAIQRLRERKHREEKALALMFPSLESVKQICEVSAAEARLLCAPEAPIVLLRRRKPPRPPGESPARQPSLEAVRAATELSPESSLAANIAPGNPQLGVMLPYTPLHHLLLVELGFPVVATSGNLSDEPICTDENEAFERLRDIADLFLVHDRPIARQVDDSIARVLLDREMVLRRARGYAPLPVTLESANRDPQTETVLAVGAHLKNTVALAVGPKVFLSQHIGDLETEPANAAFRRVLADFQQLYAATPTLLVADRHPDYLSTRYAQAMAKEAVRDLSAASPSVQTHPDLRRVQHHVAHVLACMAENEQAPPLLGVAWDGTGYGLDGTIWGGEFFLLTENTVERVAHFRPFPLPGGDAAVKEPRRAALGLLHELGQSQDPITLPSLVGVFSEAELNTLRAMLQRGINSPLCSSVGRLFDAVASLVNLRHAARFEGQAAMELEFALDGVDTAEAYPIQLSPQPGGQSETGVIPVRVDWGPMVKALLADVTAGVAVGVISARFHNALVETIVAVARHVTQARVVLSGGCFQNRYLTERTVTRLRAEGFQPYWHQRVPPNDGGIALGQVVAARRGLTVD
jgi:hydrogenase maturation protein HypF